MGLRIKITDGKNASTAVECAGAQDPITAAGQITDWYEEDSVISGGTTINKQPFASGGGNCRFSSGTLSFAAARQRRMF
jgi:surface antigen